LSEIHLSDMSALPEGPDIQPQPVRNAPSDGLVLRLSAQVSELEDALARQQRRLWIERGLGVFVLAAALGGWAFSRGPGSTWAVYVDGKPVVAMSDRGALEPLLASIKKQNPGAAAFEKAEVRAADAGQVAVTDLETARRALKDAVATYAPRGVIYVDGKPAIALQDANEAQAVLTKLKTEADGKLDRVESAPYFKEQVEVRTEPAPRELWADAAGAKAALLGRGGSATHIVKSGETGWIVARREGLSLSELERLNPGVNLSRLRVGQGLAVGGKDTPAAGESVTVVTTGEVTETVATPFRTKTTPRPLMWIGKRIRARKGLPGKERVQYRVTFENGQIVRREILNRTLVEAPQDELVAVGTKPRRG
jgi:hypothetical protein